VDGDAVWLIAQKAAIKKEQLPFQEVHQNGSIKDKAS